MREFKKVLPINLKYLRKKRGLAVSKLSKRSEVAMSMIVSIEGGKRFPSITTLHQLCEGLKCKPDDLLLEIKNIDYNDKGEQDV